MKLSVLITSYRRPDWLKRCFDGLVHQIRLPDQVVIVVRDTDADTRACAAQLAEQPAAEFPVDVVTVTEPGVVAANNAGLPLVTGDVVSFIDDDAVAPPDWLERIESYFKADPSVGAVGGRDVLYKEGKLVAGHAEVVGTITWYGKIVGNHHLRSDGARYVDHLKGVNMSLRTALIEGCDPALGGDGYSYELELCLAVRDRGYRILYDNTLTVEHRHAPRFVGGSRNWREPERIYWKYRNFLHVGVKRLHGMRLAAFLAWHFGPHLLWQGVYSVRYRDLGLLHTVRGMCRGLCSGVRARADLRAAAAPEPREDTSGRTPAAVARAKKADGTVREATVGRLISRLDNRRS
ncbi:MAG: glycosyltransferase family 2 protein [Pirellulales bacterium]